MKVTPRRGMPDLSPIPSPLAQIADWHRGACRAASLHGLDMAAPGDRTALSALMGWDPAPDHFPRGWRRRITNADRLRAMQRLERG